MRASQYLFCAEALEARAMKRSADEPPGESRDPKRGPGARYYPEVTGPNRQLPKHAADKALESFAG